MTFIETAKERGRDKATLPIHTALGFSFCYTKKDLDLLIEDTLKDAYDEVVKELGRKSSEVETNLGDLHHPPEWHQGNNHCHNKALTALKKVLLGEDNQK